jgi:putative acetyltransferase
MKAGDIVVRERVDADEAALLDTWVASWREARPDLDFEARRPWFVERMRELANGGSATLVAISGLGIAERLMQAARILAPHGIGLHVNQDNARAIRFYEKQGFAVTGTDVNPRSGAPIYKMDWRPRGSADV